MTLSRTRLVALWKAKKVSENVNLFMFLKLLTESIALWQCFHEACPVHLSQEEIGSWKHQCHFKYSAQHWTSHEKLFRVCFWCIHFRKCWMFMWLNSYLCHAPTMHLKYNRGEQSNVYLEYLYFYFYVFIINLDLQQQQINNNLSASVWHNICASLSLCRFYKYIS